MHSVHYTENIRLKEYTYRNYQRKQNREKVLRAISILKKATPTQILEFITKKSEEDAKEYFFVKNLSYNPEEFEKKKKELSLKRRAMFNILSILTNENIIINRNGVYSLNEFISNNKFLIFPDELGESIIYSIGNFFPTTIEKSLEEYVNRYGLFVIIVFLRLMYFRNSIQNENKEITLTDNEINLWIKDTIPMKLMFDLFSDLYLNNKENTKTNNLPILKGLNKALETKYPSLYREFDGILQENKELRRKSKQGKELTEIALNKFEKEKRQKKIFKQYKLKDFELPSIIDNRAYSQILPKDWWNQLSQLAKDYSNKQK